MAFSWLKNGGYYLLSGMILQVGEGWTQRPFHPIFLSYPAKRVGQWQIRGHPIWCTDHPRPLRSWAFYRRWWLNQPIWKIYSSYWIISSSRDEHKHSLKKPLNNDFCPQVWSEWFKTEQPSGTFSLCSSARCLASFRYSLQNFAADPK